LTEYTLAAALVGIAALHVWTVFQHKQERKDLLTRLMARDLTEYQAAINTRPPPKSVNPIRDNIKRQYEAVK
jgi:hypothetical protein